MESIKKWGTAQIDSMTLPSLAEMGVKLKNQGYEHMRKALGVTLDTTLKANKQIQTKNMEDAKAVLRKTIKGIEAGCNRGDIEGIQKPYDKEIFITLFSPFMEALFESDRNGGKVTDVKAPPKDQVKFHIGIWEGTDSFVLSYSADWQQERKPLFSIPPKPATTKNTANSSSDELPNPQADVVATKQQMANVNQEVVGLQPRAQQQLIAQLAEKQKELKQPEQKPEAQQAVKQSQPEAPKRPLLPPSSLSQEQKAPKQVAPQASALPSTQTPTSQPSAPVQLVQPKTAPDLSVNQPQKASSSAPKLQQNLPTQKPTQQPVQQPIQQSHAPSSSGQRLNYQQGAALPLQTPPSNKSKVIQQVQKQHVQQQYVQAVYPSQVQVAVVQQPTIVYQQPYPIQVNQQVPVQYVQMQQPAIVYPQHSVQRVQQVYVPSQQYQGKRF
jgi:hypothetical protein